MGREYLSVWKLENTEKQQPTALASHGGEALFKKMKYETPGLKIEVPMDHPSPSVVP